MAVVITRTPWIDDDGTGETGTVLNNAMKTGLYNEIDTALAKVAQLAGGNTFTGNQAIAGVLTVSGFGAHVVSAGGTGQNNLQIRNTAAGQSAASLWVGNDLDAGLMSLTSYSSTYTSALTFQVANGTSIYQGGAGGIAFCAFHASGAVRFFTGGSNERLRIAPTGEVLIGAVANASGSKLLVAADLAANIAAVFQNTNAGNSGNFVLFTNSAGAVAGNIAQSGATSVAYGTTSDARLKDDAGRATDLASLRAVVVHDFTWKADGVRDRGVFAQDAHALYPRAVVPGTDETTERGDLARPWMTDYSKFVPDLIVGWQQHDAELAALRAALAAVSTAL